MVSHEAGHGDGFESVLRGAVGAAEAFDDANQNHGAAASAGPTV